MKYEHLFMDRIKTCAYTLILTVLIFFTGENFIDRRLLHAVLHEIS